MKRKLYQKLLDEKDSKKISVVIGPRQVGKTTLLKQLHQELGGLYLDFDILEVVERFGTYTNFINSLKLEGYDEKNKFYLFIDEFQNYKDMSKILKNVYDNHENIKIYATGSSSINIKNSIQESLAGRKFIHYIYPLDFEEFLEFKGVEVSVLERLRKFKGKLPSFELKELIEEFMLYGAYPEVVLVNNKEEVLGSIFDTFIKKDLLDYLKISEVLPVKRLIQYFAINNGQKVNLVDVSMQLGVSREKIEDYIEILQETFILKKIVPFFTNKNKEIVKAYKIYFVDPGVRNYFLKNFNPLEIRQDVGFLFETFILGEILKNSDFEIKFWQDKQKHEVDFIIDMVHKQIALEVKYKENLKSEDYRNLKYVQDRMGKCYVVNLKLQDDKHLLPFSVKNLFEKQ